LAQLLNQMAVLVLLFFVCLPLNTQGQLQVRLQLQRVGHAPFLNLQHQARIRLREK